MLETILTVLGALDTASGIYSNLQDKGGGVGGATPAQVQGGQTGLQYQDVAGTAFAPFEYQEVLAQLEDEEQQRQMTEALSLAQEQGLWSGGIIGLMQGGPLYANEGEEIEVEDVDGTDPEVEEEFDWENFIEILSKIEGITGALKESPVSVTARRSVTPLPGGGIGKRQAPYPQPKGSGITPFMFQPAAGGGALGRSMFMQNYMPHGGAMRGPGGPKDDLIPVMASDGEYMLSKAAVDQAGGGNHAKGIARLEQFNQLGNRRYG
jgi:hypothetical protein